MTLTEAEDQEWLALDEEEKALKDRTKAIELRRAQIVSDLFVRVLQQGEWEVTSHGSDQRSWALRPKNSSTELYLASYATQAARLGYHDRVSLDLGDGLHLQVLLDDGNLSVQFLPLRKKEVSAGRKVFSLAGRVDLTAWVSAAVADRVRELDRTEAQAVREKEGLLEAMRSLEADAAARAAEPERTDYPTVAEMFAEATSADGKGFVPVQELPVAPEAVPPEPERWCVVSDDSGHAYLCPAARRTEAVAMLEAIEAHWSQATPGGDAPAEPDFLTRIDGASSLTFLDPRGP